MLGGILGGLSLIQNFLGQQSADRARGRAMSLEEAKLQMEQEQQRRLIEQFDKVKQLVDTARKGGVYDPNAWAKNFGDQFQKNAAVLQNRTNRNMIGAGYQPTDSEYKYGTDRLNRTLNYDLAQGQVQARQQAVASEANAINSANPNYLTSAVGMNGNDRLSQMLWANADRQQPDWGASLAAILPLLQKRNRGGQWDPYASGGPVT